MEHSDEVRDRTALFLRSLEVDSSQKPVSSNLAFGKESFDLIALESFLNENKANLEKSEKVLQIDLSTLQKRQQTDKEVSKAIQ